MEIAVKYEGAHMAGSTCENVSYAMCTQQRFRSACTFVQSDQNLHWAHFEQPRMQSFFMWTTKTMIRLRGCATDLSLH